MLMTTKNGKAITRALALVMCVLMLLAFATACTDENAVKQAEAANTAAEKAEAEALKANQAALDAAQSAKDAMDKALAAETLAGTKLTEKQVADAITAALADYAKASDVAAKVDFEALKAEVTKLLTEDAIKALIKAGDDAAVADVKAELKEDIDKIIADYATTAAVQAHIDDIKANYITTAASEAALVAALTEYFTTADAEALEADLLETIDTITGDMGFVIGTLQRSQSSITALQNSLYGLSEDVAEDFASVREAIGLIGEDIVDINATLDAQAALKEHACIALESIIEDKAEIIANIRGSYRFYSDSAYDTVISAYDVALVAILKATDNAGVDTAKANFEGVLAGLPTVEKEYYDLYQTLTANGRDLLINFTAGETKYTDGEEMTVGNTLATIKALLADATFMANHPGAFTAYDHDGEANTAAINLEDMYEGLQARIEKLQEAWENANDTTNGVVTLINKLVTDYKFDPAEGTVNADIANYAELAQLKTDIAAIDADTTGAIDVWKATYFSTTTDTTNIERMLYNIGIIGNATEDTNDKLDTAYDLVRKLESLENYDDYITNLLGANGLTEWTDNGYILINNVIAITADIEETEIDAINKLKADYDADQVNYEFEGATGSGATADLYATLKNAYDYAAYAKTRQDLLVLDEGTSELATALENVIALHNGENYLAYSAITAAAAENKFTLAGTAYNAWYVASETGIALKFETIKDILNAYRATFFAELETVNDRRAELVLAKFYADILNDGDGAYAFPADADEAIYTFAPVSLGAAYDPDKTYYTLAQGGDATNYADYEKFNGTTLETTTQYYTATAVALGINDFLQADKATVNAEFIKYYHVIELGLIADLIADWDERFHIPAEGETGYVAENYELINRAGRDAAYAAADALITKIFTDYEAETKAFADAMTAFNAATEGENYTTLYGYTLIQEAIDACNAWYYATGVTKTVGIARFEDLRLTTAIGDLLDIKTNKYEGQPNGTYYKASVDYNAALYTAFAVGTFDIDAYEPTIYDAFVRDAYANASAWVEKYLDERGFDFTDANNKPRSIDSCGLLTKAVYENVCAAYEKYNDFIVDEALADLNMIIDGDDTVRGYNDFKVETNWLINIITDEADIEAIEAKVNTWTSEYVDASATAAADDRVIDYQTKFNEVSALRTKYESIYQNVKTEYDNNVAKLVTNIGESYTADLYSMIHTDDALYIARDTYNTSIWAALENANIVKTQDAYAEVTEESDELLKNLKAAIVAIEALEAEVTANKADRNEAGATFVANVADKIGTDVSGIGTNDVQALADLRAEYNNWKNGTATLLGGAVDTTVTDTYYNTAEIVAAEALLAQAEAKLAGIKDLLADVIAKYEALKLLDNATPDKLVITNSDTTAWETAAKALANAIKTYTEGNADALVEGKLVAIAIDDVKLTDGTNETEDQISKIYTYEALYGSIEALERAQTVYNEYEAIATETNPAKVKPLEEVRNTMIKVIVDAANSAEHDSYDTVEEVNKVESFLRAQMNAVMVATGTTITPSYDDFKNDLENWGGNN